MALTIEDGSVVTGADSYATLAEYQAYLTSVGLSASGVDATDEANLRRARMYLDSAYVWLGTKVQSGQPLRWPRYIAEYVDGFIVPTDEIPQAIKDAQCEMAYIIQGGTDPFATIDSGAVTKAREKVDVIETEYEYKMGRDRPAFTAVDQLVRPYVTAKAGQQPLSVGLIRG